MERAPRSFPIVGIGASAGGIEALEAFFKGVDPNSGCAFVIVTHLPPERRSMLPEIVARYTSMPVRLAEDGAEVRMNEVYVLPTSAVLGIEGGRLQVRKSTSSRRERKPIDVFFSALAKDKGDQAAGVVLSGGDGDGTLGAKAIKERGGLTLAQTADGAAPQYPDMPESAIASGMIDLAIPAGEMGARLADFAQGIDGLSVDEDAPDRRKALRQARQEIYALLRNQIGHDFSGYKEKTFLRRVQRRMQVHRLDTLAAYIERMRQDPKEVHALFRDLLISVTNFFRDADAFVALEQRVIPDLFAGRGADDTVRVWVPGCATGEEVFSIAILMCEHMNTLTAVPKVQIFATDIDEAALTVARSARFPEALLEGVSLERRKAFFTYDDGSYVLAKSIRDLCIFSPHSVIRDPPFSRIDLVSCRNLLIYLGPEIQRQVIPTFHYALQPNSYLFLGSSENVTQFSELFTVVDRKHRIFRSREDVASSVKVPLIIGGARPGRHVSSARGNAGLSSHAVRQSVEAHVLDRFAPAHVVVNRDGDVVYFSARTGKYLEATVGAPSRHLLSMARKTLRLDLRTVFREALETEQRVQKHGVMVEDEEGRVQRLTLTVEPLGEPGGNERLFVVIFADQGSMMSREERAAIAVASDDASLHLEQELRETRERLQTMIEEYETALEEVRSSNEELMSVNEELQSTNEELEASKEELQSLNEELHTVNSELNGKVEALDRANTDLTNIFDSSKVATIFLDRRLTIRTFTPAVSQFFSILPTDKGRPLTDLTSRISLPGLEEQIRDCFRTGETIERTVTAQGAANYYLLRLVPYRDRHQTEGVILTFVDVTSLTRAEAQQKVLIEELNHRVKNMLTVIVGIADQTQRSVNDPVEFKARLLDRIRSMAKSYELLSNTNWTSTTIRDLIAVQLAPFGNDRFSVSGPPVFLRPKQALSFGMIVHELATNASKYGALSVAEGRLSVVWEKLAGDASIKHVVTLSWSEKGGPKTSEPQRTGFGLKLVERQTVHDLQGKASFDFARDGLSVSIAFSPEGNVGDQ